MAQLPVQKNDDLSICSGEVLVLAANWLLSLAGGHHLPYMPGDKTAIWASQGLVRRSSMRPVESVRPCEKW